VSGALYHHDRHLGFSTALPSAHNYEDLLSRASDQYALMELDEYTPMGLCYTSATTGRPKGVMYTHRGVYLHSMTECMVDTLAIGEQDRVMAVVPMFHANCWGLPYSCTLAGSTQVLPGVRPDPKTICQLIERERVTYSAGVPTIWIGVLDYLERSGESYDFSTLREIVSGGSAVPPSLVQAYSEKLGIKLA
jgi:fatty-acyl-CoA synthase